MDLSALSGYEFEDFIANFLKTKGFTVTQTDYSGDGGIDIIARLDIPLFSGKYIIQCKKYEGLIGQPEIRDLYGVVMAESANKGILITTSDFSEKAYDFARGKQLELINGDKLRKLLAEDSSILSELTDKTTTFINNPGFNTTRYNFLKARIEENPKEEKNYRDWFSLLYDYIRQSIITEAYDNCSGELFKKAVVILGEWDQQCHKSKSFSIERTMCSLLKANLYLISGDIPKATDILLDCGPEYYEFSEYEEFWPYIVIFHNDINGFRIEHKDHNISDRVITSHNSSRRMMAQNLYSAFCSIGYQRGIILIKNKLKLIRKAEDYIIRRSPFSVVTMGVRGWYVVDNYTAGVQNEIEQMFNWYRKFEKDATSDSFYLASFTCEKENKSKKYIVEELPNFSEYVVPFSNIRRHYYDKPDKAIREELDNVLDCHGV